MGASSVCLPKMSIIWNGKRYSCTAERLACKQVVSWNSGMWKSIIIYRNLIKLHKHLNHKLHDFPWSFIYKVCINQWAEYIMSIQKFLICYQEHILVNIEYSKYKSFMPEKNFENAYHKMAVIFHFSQAMTCQLIEAFYIFSKSVFAFNYLYNLYSQWCFI